ncbi:MAG: phosphatase PAP2 family protein, partial [Candidatus Symbiothrix sp.]|nr:phosphatase PAP2 family protein [Candidatus Symbiothrix sp.]
LCFLFVFIYRKKPKEILLVLLSVALLIFLCDRISSGFFKPVFHRFRPTHHPDFQDEVKIIFGYRGGLYGFISSHAANAFGFAVFTALLFRNRLLTGTMLLFATINAYSRVYMGVHFISDVAAGALTGALTGYAVYRLYLFFREKCIKPDKSAANESPYPAETAYFLSFAYLIITVTLLLCASGMNT